MLTPRATHLMLCKLCPFKRKMRRKNSLLAIEQPCSYLPDDKTIAWDREKHNKFTLKLKSLRILQDRKKETGGV